MKEVQEARQIKRLHQPSKVMDMEQELHVLRLQLAEKSQHSLQLQKELAISKRSEMNMYELDGTEALGSYLRICPCLEIVPEPSECSFQWYRLTSEAGKKELISGILVSYEQCQGWSFIVHGATKSVYAPEPFDVGRILQAEVITNGHIITVTTTGPIDPVCSDPELYIFHIVIYILTFRNDHTEFIAPFVYAISLYISSFQSKCAIY
ncbi:hypothetical protein ACH5RR_015332 [Cinchona calisaya]|uniref:Uncharacterized protein n=1 Tax=Cinchona calisaya TaxID=153742 RepID=A0ABD2ZY79_9GENT